MLSYAFRRSAIMLLVIFLASLFLFSVFIPRPQEILLPQNMTREQVQMFRSQFHLNDPLIVRYGRWMWDVLRGDLGISLNRNEKVTILAAKRIPNTLTLILSTFIAAYILGILLGLAAAYDKSKWVDKIIMAFTWFGLAVPAFWLAAILSGYLGRFLTIHPTWMTWVDRENILMFISVLCIVLAVVPGILFHVRELMSDKRKQNILVNHSPPSRKTEVWRYWASELVSPILSRMGLVFSVIVGYVIIIENISSSGLGTLLLQSIKTYDFTLSLGVALIFTTMVITVFFVTDVIRASIDKQFRQGKIEADFRAVTSIGYLR